MNDPSNSTPRSPGQVRPSFLRRHVTTILLLLIAGGVVWFRWPMLKGMYYGAADAAAPESGIAWRTDFDAALGEARTGGKPVLLDFTAGWCPPCRVMKHEVWPDAQVRTLANENYVPVLIDVDRAEHRSILQRYGVSGIPSILVVDGEGTVLRKSGFLSRAQMVRFLQEN
jgi:protein disulfide-isomerase